MARRSGTVTLSIVLAGDEPPSEFRIFTAGKVETTKGVFTFDDSSAKSVMAEYAAHGIDLPLDYDHAMVAGLAVDPAQAGKAAGWFNLELRMGELWAVNVRWTPPAAEALRRKEWRFMSPAFQTDGDGRITSVLNVALTNLPATRRLDPLMAASVKQLAENGMTLEEFMKVCKALGLDMSMSLDDAMAKIKGESADPDATTEDAPPPAGDGGADEAVEMSDAPPADSAKEEDKQAVAASLALMFRTTGANSIVGLADRVMKLLALEAENDSFLKSKAAFELGKRKENAIALTKLGAETPHTTGLAKGKLCKRLLDEPLDEQTERVKVLLAAKGGKLPAEINPPPGDGAGVETKTFTVDGKPITLDERELKICADQKCDPATFAMLKARRTPKT